MELKNLRVAMIPIDTPVSIDQSSCYIDIIKAVATWSSCIMIPITDYFQMQNDEELPEHWSFLLDTENNVELTGTNIDGIHQHNFHEDFVKGSPIGDAQLQLVPGMEVVENDGNIATVYSVYSARKVSLSLDDYKDIERDFQTDIEDIRLPEVK